MEGVFNAWGKQKNMSGGSKNKMKIKHKQNKPWNSPQK